SRPRRPKPRSVRRSPGWSASRPTPVSPIRSGPASGRSPDLDLGRGYERGPGRWAEPVCRVRPVGPERPAHQGRRWVLLMKTKAAVLYRQPGKWEITEVDLDEPGV